MESLRQALRRGKTLHTTLDILSNGEKHIWCFASNAAALAFRKRLYRSGAKTQGWRVRVKGVELWLEAVSAPVHAIKKETGDE